MAILKYRAKSVTRATNSRLFANPASEFSRTLFRFARVFQQFANSIYIRFINAMLFARYDPVYMARTQLWGVWPQGTYLYKGEGGSKRAKKLRTYYVHVPLL